MIPYVICHMLGSVDGRIKQNIWGFKDHHKYFEEPASKIKADAWLVGRVTMQEFSSKKIPAKTTSRVRIPKEDFVAEHSFKTFAVVIDPSGKCYWDTNNVSTEHVIEVLTEKVSSQYLEHLRSKNVSYVFGGKTELDLKLVLKKLYKLFGIKRLRIDGGGHVNGSFLEAGLIDEFSLVLAPVADGTIGAPTVFESAEGYGKRKATHFKLKSVKKIYDDFLWIRYEVIKDKKSATIVGMPVLHPSQYLPAAMMAQLRALAPEAERLEQLHPEQLAIIYEQQWFNLLTPKRYGGQELPLPAVLQLQEALSYTDGSMAWVVTLCSGAGWFGGFLEPMLASELFNSPQACLAGSGAATGIAHLTDTGYTINGYWKHATGALHATAFTANCILHQDGKPLLETDGSPLVKAFVFKKSEVRIHKTWTAMGMTATGSYAFEVDALCVPANRCFSITPKAAQLNTPLCNYPFLQLAETTLSANIAGMTARFIDLCSIQQKKHQERPTAIQFGKVIQQAQEQLKTVRNNFYTTALHSWQAVIEASIADEQLLQEVSAKSLFMVQTCRRLVMELYPYAGLEAANINSELNRVWRNLFTATQHALFSPVI